jgi:hypothetical protein
MCEVPVVVVTVSVMVSVSGIGVGRGAAGPGEGSPGAGGVAGRGAGRVRVRVMVLEAVVVLARVALSGAVRVKEEGEVVPPNVARVPPPDWGAMRWVQAESRRARRMSGKREKGRKVLVKNFSHRATEAQSFTEERGKAWDSSCFVTRRQEGMELGAVTSGSSVLFLLKLEKCDIFCFCLSGCFFV